MPRSKEYIRDYMAQRRARVKAAILALMGGRCAKCSSVADLESDHVDPKTKSFQLSGRGLDRPWSEILAEVAKCQLLCHNCHVAKSKEEAAVEPLEHGTQRMYRQGCRCDSCGAAHRVAKQRYSQNTILTHGSAQCYQEMPCRCDPCKQAKRLYRQHLLTYTEVMG